MPTIGFYRQVRVDGGVRTGIDIDGDAVLQRFDPGAGDDDPALLWYVDIDCNGESLPDSAEDARQWLIDNAGRIVRELSDAADQLEIGADDSWRPWRRTATEGGVQVEVSCMAVRRLANRRLGRHVRELADSWPRVLASLETRAVA
jgi:hypothetical protein